MWPKIHDTIAAVATPLGSGARQIIRISGPEAWSVARRVIAPDAECPEAEPLEPLIIRTSLRWQEMPGPLPCDLYYWPAGRSYTGQPVVELHTLSCGPLADQIIAQLNVRLAERGEFTLRAFLSGRIDLTQAEAVLGVIEARGDRELEIALQQLAGGIAGPLRDVREELLNLVADVEAGLDFAEEDLPFLSWDALEERVRQIVEKLVCVKEQFEKRRARAELPRVVLVGPPNAGKSTLFNALLAKERAIVSAIPGTTRDYITAMCSCQNLDFELVDTAGVEEFATEPSRGTAGGNEHSSWATQEDVRDKMRSATKSALETADVALVCWDITQLTPEVVEILEGQRSQGSLIVLTKADLLQDSPSVHFPGEVFIVSARENRGLDTLKEAIVSKLLTQAESAAQVVASTGMRCYSAIIRAIEALDQARSLTLAQQSEDLIANALRSAVNAVAEITGEVYTEEILTRIFSRFCIGK